MTVQWNASTWLKQRSVAHISGFNQAARFLVFSVNSNPEYNGKFVIPTNRSLDIDLSEIVRLFPFGSFTVRETTEGGTQISSYTFPATTAGYINPENLLIPKADIIDALQIPVPPPAVMLQAIAGGAVRLLPWAEMFPQVDIVQKPSDIKLPVTDFRLGADLDPDTSEIEYLRTGGLIWRTDLQPLECDKTYAMVRWLIPWKYDGYVRHTFEVIKETSEAVNTVELARIDNEYDIRKGQRDGFTLRLTGLSRYDVWYYGTIVTSSDVQITTENLYNKKVEVTTKKVELPTSDEGEGATLEIEVNWARYDTV